MLNDKSNYDEGSAAGRRFRRKFRVPRIVFDQILAEARKVPGWDEHVHVKGPSRHPLDLKVLAGLYHLGKDADTLVLEDLCGLSQSLLKAWLHKFVHWLATEVYPLWVKLPRGSKLDYALKVSGPNNHDYDLTLGP